MVVISGFFFPSTRPRAKPPMATSSRIRTAVPPAATIYIGSAGWNIPRAHRDEFPAEGSQLARYAARLNAAEINTSFYRPHAPAIYERWASAVPGPFRFAVKMPKLITHERALMRVRDPLIRFVAEIAGLGTKLGPLLVQLPPSFAFDARRVGRFCEVLRGCHPGSVVCEPRHGSWTSPEADHLLDRFQIARVAADPARAPGLGEPGGWRGLVYYRWHGSPRPYFSPYGDVDLDRLAQAVTSAAVDAWCIFDNTGSGSAARNGLDLAARLLAVRRPARRRLRAARRQTA
jgi:uncharacterized protein YecE (DUF72 family)